MPSADEILATIMDRARKEYGDYGTVVAEDHVLDGTSRVVQLDNDVIEPDGIDVRLDGVPLVEDSTYQLDATNGRVVLTSLPAPGALLSVTGTSWQFMTDAELAGYVDSAVAKHVHGRVLESLSVDTQGFRRFARVLQSVATLPKVEWHPVALLAALEALHVVRADAAYDINAATAEATSVAASQRYQQITVQIQDLERRYRELCTQLNVGLWRIQVGDLRRVSLQTGKYVPLYPAREIDDYSVTWDRYLPPRDFPAELVSGQQPADFQRYDPSVIRGRDWSVDIEFPFDLTGKVLVADITIGAGSFQEQWGQVLRPPAHKVTIDIVPVDATHVTLQVAGDVTDSLPSVAPWRLDVDGDPYLAGTFIAQEAP